MPAGLLLTLLAAALPAQSPRPPDPPATRVLVLSSADMLKNEFLLQGEEYEPNRRFVLAAVRALCGEAGGGSRPRVAFFDGRRPRVQPGRPPVSDYSGVVKDLEEHFDVDQIALKEKSSLGDPGKPGGEARPSCLVAVQPHGLEERQVYEISRAVSEGMPAVILVSYHWLDISESGLKAGFPVGAIRPGVEGLLAGWGINLDLHLLASRSCASLPLPKQVTAKGKKETIRALQPLAVLVKVSGEALNSSHPLLKDIPHLVFPAAVGLSLNGEGLERAKLKATEIANSGKESWSVRLTLLVPDKTARTDPPAVLRMKELSDPASRKDGFSEPRALAVLLEGKFPFAYRNLPAPDWKKD